MLEILIDIRIIFQFHPFYLMFYINIISEFMSSFEMENGDRIFGKTTKHQMQKTGTHFTLKLLKFNKPSLQFKK